MPFKEPNRRDSWPPTILRLHDDDVSPEEIDANPFAYFLTSPSPDEDEDDFDGFEDLSAGIEAPHDPQTPIREVSPSSLQRIPMDQQDDPESSRGFTIPLSLRDFTHAHSTKKGESTFLDVDLDRAYPHALRGRPSLRLASPPHHSPRGRAHTRSLSAPRPRSWHLPSPDVWSIPEEKEEEEEEEDTRTDDDDMPSLSDAYEEEQKLQVDAASAMAEHEEALVFTEPATKKVKKKVHWAALPTRDS